MGKCESNIYIICISYYTFCSAVAICKASPSGACAPSGLCLANQQQHNKVCNNDLLIVARGVLSLQCTPCLYQIQAVSHLLQALTTEHDGLADL